MAHIHDSIIVNAPVDEVFAFGRNPRRWSTWWVNLSEPRKIRGDGSTGTVVDHDYIVAGLQLHVRSRVLEDYMANDGCCHWHGSFEGKFSGEQHWDYVPHGQSTEVIADIEYSVPGRVLGKVPDRLLVEKMEERAIHQTLENLKFMTEH